LSVPLPGHIVPPVIDFAVIIGVARDAHKYTTRWSISKWKALVLAVPILGRSYPGDISRLKASAWEIASGSKIVTENGDGESGSVGDRGRFGFNFDVGLRAV